MTVGFIHVSPL